MGLRDHFENFFKGYIVTVPGERMPNFRSITLVVLKLLAFNGQEFKVSRDPGDAPFSKKIFRDHVATIASSMRAKFA